MNQRFLLTFAATITLVLLTIRTGGAALSDGGALAIAGLLVFGGLAAAGFAVLARAVYLDGRASARRRDRGRA